MEKALSKHQLPIFFPSLLATALSLAEELWGSVLGEGGFLEGVGGSWSEPQRTGRLQTGAVPEPLP